MELLAEQAARDRDEPQVSLEPVQLLEISEVLALTQEASQASRRVAELAGRFLPFDQLHFALRLTEGRSRRAARPGGAARSARPRVGASGRDRARRGGSGERPHYFALHQGEARLIVPLRVAGRVHGALVLTAAPPAVLNPAHLGSAQRLADVVAPTSSWCAARPCSSAVPSWLEARAPALGSAVRLPGSFRTGPSAGRMNQKVDPQPGSDSAPIVPPCSSTSFLLSARPSPVPCACRLAVLST